MQVDFASRHESERAHIGHLNGLRGVAILAVVLFPLAPGGRGYLETPRQPASEYV
jgi:peptidoglycan/LPS O-acetylase OafA/YrhL